MSQFRDVVFFGSERLVLFVTKFWYLVKIWCHFSERLLNYTLQFRDFVSFSSEELFSMWRKELTWPNFKWPWNKDSLFCVRKIKSFKISFDSCPKDIAKFQFTVQCLFFLVGKSYLVPNWQPFWASHTWSIWLNKIDFYNLFV